MPGVRNLQTKDIIGAEADSKSKGQFTYYQRRDPPKQLTQNEDIPGSKCGTLKLAIITERQTNPLNPEYQVPGNKETGGLNDPYGLAGCSVNKYTRI
jgi:hypothetical protein